MVHLGRNTPKLDYTMNGVVLITDTSEKYLGVTIDSKLKFLLTFKCLDEVTVPKLFSALVRPH